MEKVRITDHADVAGIVRGQTFEDKEIVGPAVLVPVGEGNNLSGCLFPSPSESFLWETPAGLQKFGAVYLVDCTFHRCTFGPTIGLAVAPEQAQAMRAGLN